MEEARASMVYNNILQGEICMYSTHRDSNPWWDRLVPCAIGLHIRKVVRIFVNKVNGKLLRTEVQRKKEKNVPQMLAPYFFRWADAWNADR